METSINTTQNWFIYLLNGLFLRNREHSVAHLIFKVKDVLIWQYLK